MLYDQILSEIRRLEEKLQIIHEKKSAYPAGKLICTRNGSSIKWYRSDGHRAIYIPRKERKLAEQLAAKKYLSLLEEDLRHERYALSCYLRHRASIPNRAERLLMDPRYTDLLSPSFIPSSQELSDWMKTEYRKNDRFPEQLLHKTSSGDRVRSKSEAIICMILHINKIPFRYECALELGDTTLFPDFTIRHPRTGELLYWEHFGRMDDPVYSKDAFSKLQMYNSYGILPSVHLITTFETKANPLSSELAEAIVRHYFLDS